MGGGCWTTESFASSLRDMGFSSAKDVVTGRVQDFYQSNRLAKELDPYNVIRECRDSEEHPCTLPVILALDVTGSMGSVAKTCASKLDDIMTELYKSVKDIEFLMMGIGDMIYDDAPVQASQFESDIRILDQTSKIWFEGCGGPNKWESYTAAWYFGLYHTDLDCWKRGKKGIIITMGDEMLNPYLPYEKLAKIFGCQSNINLDDDLNTNELFKLASQKFDIFHIGITDDDCQFKYHVRDIHDSWEKLLGRNYREGDSKSLPQLISSIVDQAGQDAVTKETVGYGVKGIRW